MTQTAATYFLEGQLLEACSCYGPCPCWVGDDPDGGDCDSFNAYHIERGTIHGIDVSGLGVVSLAQIPGNVFDGNWRQVLYLDAKATPEQRRALLDVWTGKLGGPLAELTALIGERVAVYDAPIEYSIQKGKGTMRVGDVLETEMSPYTDRDGNPTTMTNTMFSTIPGSPAYMGKASRHVVNVPEHGMTWEFTGRNAIQGSFRIEW